MSIFEVIQPYNNPDEGKDIINYNFSLIDLAVFTGTSSGSTIVSAGTNIAVISGGTIPTVYTVSLKNNISLSALSATTIFLSGQNLYSLITGATAGGSIVSGGTGIFVTQSGSSPTTYYVAIDSSTATGVIGPAEDGTYTDGLFTDFTTGTTVGTAVDRFNEVLKALAPPPAPALSDWNQTTLTQSVQGNLSFDTANPISGYAPADAIGIPSPVSVDGLFTVSGKRLGVTEKVGGTKLSGILNNQVTVGPGSPFPAYPAQSFGNADQGTLVLVINGATASTIDLTVSGATDTSAGGTTTGLNVSQTFPALFPSGTALDLFKFRSGCTWTVVKTYSGFTNGYNSIIVKHVITALNILTLTRFDVVADAETVATTYSGDSLTTLAMTGNKYLSGVDYNTAGTAKYNVTISNAYRDTYSPSASAISFLSNTNTYGTILTAPAQALGANGGNENLTVSVVNKTATIASSAFRLINETIQLKTQTLRTVQGTTTSTFQSISGVLLDNVSSTSTAFIENFQDETYRLTTNSSYDLVANVAANPWDSQQSVRDGSAGHTTGLQVVGGVLIYPGSGFNSFPTDFSTTGITNAPLFNNGGTGGTARNYTALSGNRTFYRYFQQVSPTTANFTIKIDGATGTFRAASDTTGTDWIHVEIKGPTETGWMDAYNDFVTGNFGDGDGARNASAGAGRAFGVTWGLTIGTKNTSNTGGYMVVRITVPSTFVGDFTKLTFSFT